ncbi:MAG: peptide chain release factor 1 [Spirochaetia bacterium]|nr:peptide chain release factor 1 [Spirochaetia bacterium]MBR5915031.1 peptide chain release factor 1 [Spirochaetia bacterium]
MFDKLDSIEKRFKELEAQLSDSAIMQDMKKYSELMKEHASAKEIVDSYQVYKKTVSQLEEAREMAGSESDPELKEMAKEEIKQLEEQKENQIKELRTLLIPKDPLDLKNIIMEIRAGTGGDEAALFAADLFRMYSKYAELKKWKIEIMSSHESGLGGFKEIVFSVSGKNVYENMKFESGVHRVQRIPETESGGRIHTSAVTVAVLPEAEETDIQINPEDLKIDVYRSSGPGGQCVNTTDSAVRMTHIPTGLVVICQDEKSQIKNRAKALRVLRSRLYEMEEAKKQKERSEARKNQVGSGDRSERIRTYNFPQNRLTDHRINLTLYKLDLIINGELDELLDALKIEFREQLLKESAL